MSIEFLICCLRLER